MLKSAGEDVRLVFVSKNKLRAVVREVEGCDVGLGVQRLQKCVNTQWRARLAQVEQHLGVLESTEGTECNWRGVPLLMNGRLGHRSNRLMLLKRVFDKRDHGAQHSDCNANGAVLKRIVVVYDIAKEGK